MNFDVLHYSPAVCLYNNDPSYIDIYAKELLARYTFLPDVWFYHDEAKFLPLLDKDCWPSTEHKSKFESRYTFVTGWVVWMTITQYHAENS